MTTPPDVPIYQEILEEQRARTGAFARFALEPHQEPAGVPPEERVHPFTIGEAHQEPMDPNEVLTVEQPAARRSRAPRSQR